ncbi:MAG: hypothetical protein MZW92_66020 [Comamonadaceae bacterium]|nr:hypothetical protein [Comamonadaceae bacterium]
MEIWRAIHAPADGGVPLNLSTDECLRLRALRDACRGWIAWDEESGLVFVPLDEWRERVGAGGR